MSKNSKRVIIKRVRYVKKNPEEIFFLVPAFRSAILATIPMQKM